jgi:hypothetical protein
VDTPSQKDRINTLRKLLKLLNDPNQVPGLIEDFKALLQTVIERYEAAPPDRGELVTPDIPPPTRARSRKAKTAKRRPRR